MGHSGVIARTIGLPGVQKLLKYRTRIEILLVNSEYRTVDI